MRVDADCAMTTVRVRDSGGNLIQPNGVTASAAISVEVIDSVPQVEGQTIVLSGPGRLVVSRLDSALGEVVLGTNDQDFPDSHVYTAGDTGLAALGAMPEGQILVRAFDQGGRETSVKFTVRLGPRKSPHGKFHISSPNVGPEPRPVNLRLP